MGEPSSSTELSQGNHKSEVTDKLLKSTESNRTRTYGAKSRVVMRLARIPDGKPPRFLRNSWTSHKRMETRPNEGIRHPRGCLHSTSKKFKGSSQFALRMLITFRKVSATARAPRRRRLVTKVC